MIGFTHDDRPNLTLPTVARRISTHSSWESTDANCPSKLCQNRV